MNFFICSAFINYGAILKYFQALGYAKKTKRGNAGIYTSSTEDILAFIAATMKVLDIVELSLAILDSSYAP